MTFTQLQKLRKARARNKGSNRRVAASIRVVAAILKQKGPEELSRTEIVALQRLRSMLSQRLYANAYTKAMQLVMNGNFKIVGGKYRIALNPKDL